MKDFFMKKMLILAFVVMNLTTINAFGVQNNASAIKADVMLNPNQWKSLQTIDEGGLVGERVDLWRNVRFSFIADSGYLIDGFENRPGKHPWQGEHLGKWLHAGIIAYKITGDEKMKAKMDELVTRILATQREDGYIGTYADEYTFLEIPESTDPRFIADDIELNEKEELVKTWKKIKGGWDTWTFRYNIYGLLAYEELFPSEKIVEACKKMADLLIEVYGVDKHDLTKYGTRKGISATTVLESIVMLYQRTGEKKYLDFAEEIVAMSENNPGLRLMGTMLENKSVVHPGEGKAYQLMSNLLGYFRLYQVTDNEKYLRTVINAFGNIKRDHVLVTGGPWQKKEKYNGNSECFAYTDDFDAEKSKIEGCADTTWIQLCTQLFELTGDAKYFNEAELTLLNSAYGHQSIDGKHWCYPIKPNELQPKILKAFHCCGSSEPRGLEIYSDHLAGCFKGNLSINTLSPATIKLSDEFGGGTVKILGDFPKASSAKVVLSNNKSKKFTLEMRVPLNTSCNSVKVNGKTVDSRLNSRGYLEVTRKWKKGDAIEFDMEFELVATIQPGKKGQKWVAFNYGPLALAQKSNKANYGAEPFKDISFKSYELEKAVKMLKKTKSADSDIAFKIENSDVTLIPFHLTSPNAGQKTYFKCK